MISEKSGYVLSTQIAITVIYTCNVFVLFCACDVMNVLSVKKKKMKIYKKNNKKKKQKKQRMSLVEQELPTLPEHLSSPPIFSGVRVIPSLVLCLRLGLCIFYRSLFVLSFVLFILVICFVCPSSIYGFWLPLWYLQTLLLWIQ